MSPQTRSFREAELDDLIVSPLVLALYRECSCLILPRAAGTLWHVSRSVGSSVMPECCCAFYASRMCRALELLFSADLLHGDIKLDNFLIVENSANENGSQDLGRSRKDGGASPNMAASLMLIDFGRSIDRRAYE
eukprot:CAMPEP_0171685824 /NCGR_PEP_ID=MMETSP0991-20121206/2461_1 /TAXON_ID=483369 /ORGANISM="non described non described, Strain CCMP2098" /LENGTH=134 /DNA_ID=CAMNT_0012273511 /DNA_START=124 /DNA_END=525 /DNA_ORIENTATION=-